MESLVELEDFPGRLLHVAALWDNVELLEDLLHGEELSQLNSLDSWGRSALHAASTNACSGCLRILLQAGAEVNVVCGARGLGRAPIHLAAEHGHLENVELLLEHQADVDLKDDLDKTALDLAAQNEHHECVELLKQAKKKREEERKALWYTLLEACLNNDLPSVKRLLENTPEKEIRAIINNTMSSGDVSRGGASNAARNEEGGAKGSGGHTLLYLVCEQGYRDLAHLLISKGADGRSHPVTRYSPLYVSAYNGKREVVELLLRSFPHLIEELTVEQWSPLHAATISGHASVFELIFRFNFDSQLLRLRANEKFEYYSFFDVNARDVTGQTLLYLACCVSSVKIVDTLLQYRVRATKIVTEESSEKETSRNVAALSLENEQSHKGGNMSAATRVSGIQALISKLRGTSAPEEPLRKNEEWINPLELDAYCNNGTETALHNVIKKSDLAITTKLLHAGANPNLEIRLNNEEMRSIKTSTCLVEACRNRDVAMTDLLLRFGARDDDCKALGTALSDNNTNLASRLLALKAHQDSEYSVNKRGISETSTKLGIIMSSAVSGYSAMVPSVPVTINWHDHGLNEVKEAYLNEAVLKLNNKLRLSPKFQSASVHAITRLDLSNNALVELPVIIWGMQSLKSLNVAQNKLESLPGSSNRIGLNALKFRHATPYLCPWLEEVYLQDNRLEQLPTALFKLPSLHTLDVSNNKLQCIPFDVWQAPALKDLNLSLNLLSEMPTEHSTLSSNSSYRLQSTIDSEGEGNETVRDPSMDSLSTTQSEDGLSLSSMDTHEINSRLRSEPLKHLSLWERQVEVLERNQVLSGEEEQQLHLSCLQSLNLSHNSFSVAPKGLSCLAPSLTRLNLSHNSLQTLGAPFNYPVTLKHLDVSFNQIKTWPGELRMKHDSHCYAQSLINEMTVQKRQHHQKGKEKRQQRVSVTSKTKVETTVQCNHKSHNRFENLRTLILANNELPRMYFYSSSPSDSTSNISVASNTSEDGEKTLKIMFPALSMLDLSNNNLASVPNMIHELSNLSVLNLSFNQRINDLPPQMGLLNKLWNLNTSGCNLSEPLLTMSISKSYKTADIIGYLRSILENSKRYARLKLMVVGVQGIGKTTLLEQLRTEPGSSQGQNLVSSLVSGQKKSSISGPSDHWAKRMGHQHRSGKSNKQGLSTVGVDIGGWTYEKKGGQSLGPIVFRTWDFGGQTEYYATHQYFLSKRSLYLVVWKITDGEKALNEIQQWLINIQARAPNSPVIIVGTHVDLARDEFAPSFCDFLQDRIRDRFINITDAEKFGLPRVLQSFEVSCNSRSKCNIRELANFIYDSAMAMKSSGCKVRLLDQKIPATYLALEDIVVLLASQQRQKHQDPVMNDEQFRRCAALELEKRFNMRFRDNSELNQAVKFLHENGVLLHYEDATLRDLYFLEPQWLCDMLSHVVTVREINPFVKQGVMRIDDLRHVFKNNDTTTLVSAKSYIVQLLNKFEVALTWDTRTLLIPSLLPSEQQMRKGLDTRVKIAVRSRGWAGGRHNKRNINQDIHARSVSMPPARHGLLGRRRVRGKDESNATRKTSADPPAGYKLSTQSEAEHSVHRLLFMSYFPSGFWSRLLTRILADDTVVEIIRNYFVLPNQQDSFVNRLLIEHKPEWVCWQTGVELRYMDTVLFSMKQVLHNTPGLSYDYHRLKIMLLQEDKWTQVDSKQSSVMEIWLPQDTVVVHKPIGASSSDGYQTLALDASPRAVCQLLTLAVEHVDTLLEDWYPSLGTRFLHTSEGRMLVTRLVPCSRCLCATTNRNEQSQMGNNGDRQGWYDLVPERLRAEDPDQQRVSQDSGMGHEEALDALVALDPDHRQRTKDEDEDEGLVYAFLIEACILNAFETKQPLCPAHGELSLAAIAPDTVFLDMDERVRISSDQIRHGRLVGRGAFGFVYESVLRQKGSLFGRSVATKMLQPVDPGPNAKSSAKSAYELARAKWERDPLQYTCKAYCTARQELNILIHLRHSHIVPLVGICSQPLAIVLELAPQGALDEKLKHYRRSGDKLEVKCVQLIVLQIARALEYLHQNRIIYRDLKAENVLVWALPEPFAEIVQCGSMTHNNCSLLDTHVKLADYGISRATLPSGTKGFGGTEGFMAPEIMRYNGEEEYTEKVDAFSFAMFLYELVTLHQPFAGYETVKELILEGNRPAISHRELVYPSHVLDLMAVCWSHRPRDRPSASQIVNIASAPEFVHLTDVVAVPAHTCVASAVVVASNKGSAIKDNGEDDNKSQNMHLWLACSSTSGTQCNPWLHVLQLEGNEANRVCNHHRSLEPLTHAVTAMCLVEDVMWIGDDFGYVHGYDTTTLDRKFSYKMEPDSAVATTSANGINEVSGVRSIHFLSEIRRACVALGNGRLFLCCSDVVPKAEEGLEGTFIVTELGSSSNAAILDVASVRKTSNVFEIWCGESSGHLSVFTLVQGVVSSLEMLQHSDSEVLQVISSDKYVWTCLYPGCVIFQWSIGKRSIINQLDCSKLVPSSESLKTIEEPPFASQLLSIAVLRDQLYAGTNLGCVIVADADSLRPIAVFRPYAQEVQRLITVGHGDEHRIVISVGRGYRDLIYRFVPNEYDDDDERDNLAVLLWRPDQWICL